MISKLNPPVGRSGPAVLVPPAVAATAAKPISDPQWQQDHDNIVRRASYFAVLLLVFIRFSFIHEILQVVTHHNLYLLYIVAPPALLGMILSGGLSRVVQYRAGVLWIAFMILVVIGLPFSTWRGQSAVEAFHFMRDQLALLFLIAGTVMTWKEARRILYIAAVSLVIDLVFAKLYGAAEMDRFRLDYAGTIANANDFAAHLLFLIALLLFVLLRPKSIMVVKALSLALIGGGMFMVLRTGSRGAVVATAAAALMFFFRATTPQRMAAILLIPIVLAGVLVMIPQDTYLRLTSFNQDEGSEEAALSAMSRTYLLKKSIEFTFTNPIFGVGMGQFANYEGSASQAVGLNGNWHETHNAYTQISSECGIPALFLYLAAIVSTFGIIRKVQRQAKMRGHPEIVVAMTALTIALVAFCVAIAFLSLAYRYYLPAMTGLAIAIQNAMNNDPALRQPEGVSSL